MSTRRKMNIEFYYSSCAKKIKEQKTRHKTPTLSEKSIGKAWQNKGTGKNFLKRTPTVQEIVPGVDKWH